MFMTDASSGASIIRTYPVCIKVPLAQLEG